MFRDRSEAGRMLGEEIVRLRPRDPVVLALPRGGVPVACEVAKAVGARIDLVIVKKIGAPGNPELAVAAIVDGDPPDVVLNREIIEVFALSDDEVAALVARGRPELERIRNAFSRARRPLSVKGKTVVIVDDGAATGVSMKVAVRAIRRRSPHSIIVALPVASQEAAAELTREADEFVSLSIPARFRALSYHYRDFPQLGDEEITAMLADVGRIPRAKPEPPGGATPSV
jgi:putative phosphoribosyl transferase